MPKASTPRNTKQPSKSYQALSAELDEVLAKLQNPDCDVDEAVGLYEQALQCIADLQAYLETAQNRITKIQTRFEAAHDVMTGNE